MPTDEPRLPTNSPVQRRAFDMISDTLDLRPDDRVVDLGCGAGALLHHVVLRTGARGTGYDLDDAVLGRMTDGRRLDHDRLRWVAAEAREAVGEAPWDAALCIGSLDTLGPTPEAWIRLHGLLRPGGRAWVGRITWRQPPPGAYLEATGIPAETYADLPSTAAAAEAAGFDVLGIRRSSEQEFDDFELRHALRRRDSSPERVKAWTRARLRWGAEVMGFTCLLLQRP